MLETLRSHRRPILMLVLACAVALVLALALPGVSRAVTRTGHDFTYYSDSSHSTVVGYRYYCPTYSGGWGSITPYYVINSFPCH